MQQKRSHWKRQVKGNSTLAIMLMEKHNLQEDFQQFLRFNAQPARPSSCVDLSSWNPTEAPLKVHRQNLQIIAQNVGKIDGYTNMQGIDQSRQVIAKKYAAPAFQITKEDVYLCHGGIQSLWIIMNLLTDAKDNFLCPAPGFQALCLFAQSNKVQARLYHLDPQDKWKANIEEMESLIDSNTKFILINDPSNPLGSCWTQQLKSQIIKICKKKGILLVVDQIYEELTYGEKAPIFAELVKPQDAGEITIIKSSGLEKRYFSPGWRMGWIIIYSSAVNQEKYRRHIRGMLNIILMPNTVMQTSIPQILQNKGNELRIEQNMQLLKQNQEMLDEALSHLPYCKVGHSPGAFYATILIDIQELNLPTIRNTIDLARMLFIEENIKVTPGEFYSGKKASFLRVVISHSKPLIEQFLKRLLHFFDKRKAKN